MNMAFTSTKEFATLDDMIGKMALEDAPSTPPKNNAVGKNAGTWKSHRNISKSQMGTNSKKKPSWKSHPVSYAQAVSRDGPHPQWTVIPHDKSQQQDEESSDEETLSTLSKLTELLKMLICILL